MKPPDLDALRLSGRISATARETCRKMIQPGVKLEKVAVEPVVEGGGVVRKLTGIQVRVAAAAAPLDSTSWSGIAADDAEFA